jgi:hypothetical protein
MNTIARFTIRPTDETSQEGDLILGGLFKRGQNQGLVPGKIYEIQNVLGELVIVDIGDSAIKLYERTFVNVNWALSINSVLTQGAGQHLLTEKETARCL